MQIQEHSKRSKYPSVKEIEVNTGTIRLEINPRFKDKEYGSFKTTIPYPLVPIEYREKMFEQERELKDLKRSLTSQGESKKSIREKLEKMKDDFDKLYGIYIKIDEEHEILKFVMEKNKDKYYDKAELVKTLNEVGEFLGEGVAKFFAIKEGKTSVEEASSATYSREGVGEMRIMKRLLDIMVRTFIINNVDLTNEEGELLEMYADNKGSEEQYLSMNKEEFKYLTKLADEVMKDSKFVKYATKIRNKKVFP